MFKGVGARVFVCNFGHGLKSNLMTQVGFFVLYFSILLGKGGYVAGGKRGLGYLNLNIGTCRRCQIKVALGTVAT